MIDRYSTEPMRRVWSDEARWERWRDVELAALRARGVGEGAYAAAALAAHPTAQEVARAEAETRHDLVAWLQAWTAPMASLARPEVHFGLTSSDVVDTALGMAVREASHLVTQAAVSFVQALAEHATAHQRTLRAGRTHGRPAEVSSWGLLCDDVAVAAHRATFRHRTASRAASVAKISGPVGTYAELGRGVEAKVAVALGLKPAGVATQVVARDRVAEWATSMVQLLLVVERFATQVRLGARDGELEEGRGERQVGSSAMPQKRNPVTAESLCGLARLGRGLLGPILESVALWDERDISHSSVERTALPDLAATTEFALLRAADLVRNLVVRDDVMRSHVHRDYVELCKHWALCRMVEAGTDRWEAHERLRDVYLVDELEDLVGSPLPDPEWFLRNVLDTEASGML